MLTKVIHFYLCFARNRVEPLDRIPLTAALNYDLGLDGDDVEDLLDAIPARCPIGWPEFDFH